MDSTYYLDIFEKAANGLEKKILERKALNVAIGEYLESVFLKLYKISWANESRDPLLSESRIFFSVWINDKTIKEHKIFYNIHALKLRQLNGYSIKSQNFAAAFRKKFKNFNDQWPNLDTKLGPLTLMQGWKTVDLSSFEKDIIDLANKFITIDYLVDELLNNYKKSGIK